MFNKKVSKVFCHIDESFQVIWIWMHAHRVKRIFWHLTSFFKFKFKFFYFIDWKLQHVLRDGDWSCIFTCRHDVMSFIDDNHRVIIIDFEVFSNFLINKVIVRHEYKISSFRSSFSQVISTTGFLFSQLVQIFEI